MIEATKRLEEINNSNRQNDKEPFYSRWLTENATCWTGGLDELIKHAEELFLSITERTNTRTGATGYELSDKEGYAGLIEQPESSNYRELAGDGWLMIVVHS